VADRLPAVVTQPGFVLDRGDDYLRDVDPRDLPDLYRYRSLLDMGCTVVPSSDAPYGPLDPWTVLRAARDRRSATGAPVNPGEAVPVETALGGMLRPLEDLAAPPRRVEVGAPADLVLLAAPLAEVLADPSAEAVVGTWVAGERLV
jgi:predicted amidohydrolase YtcJ